MIWGESTRKRREGHTAKHSWAAFKGSFKVTVGILAKDVDLDRLSLVKGFEGHDGLHKQRLGIFEV